MIRGEKLNLHGKRSISASCMALELECRDEDFRKKKKKILDRITPHAYFFRKSVAVDTIGSLSKGTSECASVSQ